MKKKEVRWSGATELIVTANNIATLKYAISIAMLDTTTVTYLKVVDNVLHLGGGKVEDGATKLPTAMTDPDAVTQVVVGWLSDAKPDGREPDTDGSVASGFTVTLGDFYDVCQIKPTYIVYGK